MDKFFVFGGIQFKVLEKKVLRGMNYYHILENMITHEKMFLYCLPGD